MDVICTVWTDAGDGPDTVTKWQSFADLVQILQELGICQTMFNPHTCGPDDECFTERMRDLLLQHAPFASFGSLMAILAPYVGRHINDVTTMVASLGEMESLQQQKGVLKVSQTPFALRQKVNP